MTFLKLGHQNTLLHFLPNVLASDVLLYLLFFVSKIIVEKKNKQKNHTPPHLKVPLVIIISRESPYTFYMRHDGVIYFLGNIFSCPCEQVSLINKHDL